MSEAPAEESIEWREARMLQLTEGILFNPESLTRYQDNGGDVGFLDFMIERLGGRSQ